MHHADIAHLHRVIKQWAIAKVIAEDNPRLLKRNPVTFNDECVKRCKNVDLYQEIMLKEAAWLHERYQLPDSFMRFWRAVNNPACPKCKYSSKIGDMHPECRSKIDEYFAAEAILVNYGLSLKE